MVAGVDPTAGLSQGYSPGFAFLPSESYCCGSQVLLDVSLQFRKCLLLVALGKDPKRRWGESSGHTQVLEAVLRATCVLGEEGLLTQQSWSQGFPTSQGKDARNQDLGKCVGSVDTQWFLDTVLPELGSYPTAPPCITRASQSPFAELSLPLPTIY